jgi:hypothetical protein
LHKPNKEEEEQDEEEEEEIRFPLTLIAFLSDLPSLTVCRSACLD